MDTLDNYPFLKSMQAKAGQLPSRRGIYMTAFAGVAAVFGLIGFWKMNSYGEPGTYLGFGIVGFVVAIVLALQVRGLWVKAKRALIVSINHLGDFDTVAAQIEADFAGHEESASPFEVGKTWFCYVRGRNAVVCPLDQCVWAYGDWDDINSPIVARPQISMWVRQGWKYDLQMEQEWVDHSLPRLAAAAPWLPIGYSETMRETWNADHKELAALVDRARQDRVAFVDVCPPSLRVTVTGTPKQWSFV